MEAEGPSRALRRGPLGLLLLFLGSAGAELEVSVVSPVTAAVGSDALLECTYAVQSPSVDLRYLGTLWRFNEKNLLTYGQGLTVFDSRASINESAIPNGKASVLLSNVTISDEGTYTCSITYTPQNKQKIVRLNIQARPKIIVPEQEVTMGKENFLRCFVIGFYPVDIDVFWRREGQVLPGSSLSKAQRNADGTFTINSTLPITPTASDTSANFSCCANHVSLPRFIQKDAPLLFKGAELEVSVVSPVTAAVGSDALLECTYAVPSPSVDLKYLGTLWRFNEKNLLTYGDGLNVFDPRASINESAIPNGKASMLLSNVTISDEGSYTCSIIYTPHHKQGTVTLNIQARPKIIVPEQEVIMGKENLLRCFVIGFYPVDIDVFWQREGQVLPGSSLSKAQRNADGTFTINSTLPVTPTASDTSANFSCHVIHVSLPRFIQKDAPLLFKGAELEVSVVSSVTAALGSDALLECTYTVQSPSVDLKYLGILWRFNEQYLLSYGGGNLNVFDLRATINETAIPNGKASVLLSNVTISDEGSYTCSIIYTPHHKQGTVTLNIQGGLYEGP